jgi:hypothetical protein
MSIFDRVRVYEWFSWSHWGMFREPLLTCPAWFAMGMTDLDDDDAEFLEWNENLQGEDPGES